MTRLRHAAGALLCCISALLPADAVGASLSAAVSADPVEEAPSTITLTGLADTTSRLFVSVTAASQGCEQTAALQETRPSSVRLTPSGGTAVAVGGLNQPFTFTPLDDAEYRVCGHLAATAASTPVALANVLFTVRAPSFGLNASVEPTQYEPGQTIAGRVTVVAPVVNRELRFGWSNSSTDCASSTPTPLSTVALAPGIPVDRTTNINAGQQPITRLCGYVVELPAGQREAVVEAVAAVLPRDLLIERWRPTPLTDDTEQEDRLRLRWRTRALSEDADRLEIWDTDPAEDDDPVVSDILDSDEFDLMEASDGERDVRVRRFLGFREFWWSAGTDMPSGETSWSAAQSVSVVPSAMNRKRVRVNTKFTPGYSTKRPGTTRLRITSSPRARVTATVTYRGRQYWKKRYTEGVGRLRGFDFRQTCKRQGKFAYVVQMRDPYGARVTKRGSWTTSPSRCASLLAKERREAAAEERRRRERERPKPSSGGGGSECHPSYSPQCLKEGIGDYDCSGGSGDGPNYVTGPVYISGDDPFRLDAGGTPGVGCES